MVLTSFLEGMKKIFYIFALIFWAVITCILFTNNSFKTADEIFPPIICLIFCLSYVLSLLESFNIETSLQLIKNHNPKTYSQFTFIELNFINTCQVASLNITIFNVFLQFSRTKKRTE